MDFKLTKEDYNFNPPKTVEDLSEFINGIKGEYLSVTSSIDTQLEIILAGYFTSDISDYCLFSKMFFGQEAQLTFSEKIEIFQVLLKNVYPEYLAENENIINSLNRVRKMRNKFAHHMNPTNKELEEYLGKDRFPLTYFEFGLPKNEDIAVNDIFDRLLDVQNLYTELEKINNRFDEIKREKKTSNEDSKE